MFGLGMTEIGIIIGVVVLLFGPKQIPKLARSVGETIRELKQAGRTLTSDLEEVKKLPKAIEREVTRE